MIDVKEQALSIYKELDVNNRINLRHNYQDSAYRKESFGDVCMMSAWGIIGAVQFATVWGWFWCD